MARLTVWGASYSVYSRILRLALIEKSVGFKWVETDVFDDPAARAAQAVRHPWAKIPAMADGEFRIYETRACLAYLEAGGFGSERLIPAEPRARARAEQVAGIVDAYAYPAMVWQVYVPWARAPTAAGRPDRVVLAEGLARAETVLDALEALMGETGILDGATPTLADVTLAPVIAYFAAVPEGGSALALHPKLCTWWAAWRLRPSMQATRFAPEAP